MATKLVAREPLPRFLPVGRVLVDSGPLIALFNGADHWHAPVLAWLQVHPQARLISTWPVATEACVLLARRIHNDAGFDFLSRVQRGAVQLDQREEARAPKC